MCDSLLVAHRAFFTEGLGARKKSSETDKQGKMDHSQKYSRGRVTKVIEIEGESRFCIQQGVNLNDRKDLVHLVGVI